MSRNSLLSEAEMEALLAADDELDNDLLEDTLLFTPGDFADFCEDVAPLLLSPYSQLAPLIDKQVELQSPQLSLIAPEAIVNSKEPKNLFVPLVQLAGEGTQHTALLEIPGDLAARLALLMIGGDEDSADEVEDAHLSSLRELFHQYRLLLGKQSPKIIGEPVNKSRAKSVRPVISGKRGASRLLKKLFNKKDHLLGLTANCILDSDEAGELRFVFPVELSKELLKRVRELKEFRQPQDDKKETVVAEAEVEAQVEVGLQSQDVAQGESQVKSDSAAKEVTRQPAVAKAKDTRQPAVAKAKVTRQPAVAKAKDTRQPAVASVIELTARLGKVSLSPEKMAKLGPGTVLRLDSAAGEEVELVIDGQFFARGEVTVDGDHYAVRIRVINEAARS